MPKSNASRKWDKANMTILSCRVSKEVAGQFKLICKKKETTVNAALLKYVRSVVESEAQE